MYDVVVVSVGWLVTTSVLLWSGVAIGQDVVGKNLYVDDPLRPGTTTSSAYLTSAIASNITMTSKPLVYLIGQGQTLEAMCEFSTDDFHLFDNPVVWKKIQKDEEVQINIMGNIFMPFLSTGRFEIEFESDNPNFRFVLRVSNVTVEDSGNYTCEVRGPRSAILGLVTHTVFVKAPIKQVYLIVDDFGADDVVSIGAVPSTPDHFTSGSTATLLPPSSETTSKWRRSTHSSSSESVAHPSTPLTPGARVTFVDGKPRRVGCVAVGGNPTPMLRVYLNERDITGAMKQSSVSTVTQGPLGMRLLVTRTELRGGTVTLSPAEDGCRLRCVAVVAGLAPNITETTIDVHYGPIIKCEHRDAVNNEMNVYLSCLVRARPDVTSLFWIVDVNGTTLIDGDFASGYWSMVTDRSDAIETRLYLSRATLRSFRAYTLVAENSVADTTQLVRLHRRLSEPPRPGKPGLAADGSEPRQHHHHYYYDPEDPSQQQQARQLHVLTSAAASSFSVLVQSATTKWNIMGGRDGDARDAMSDHDKSSGMVDRSRSADDRHRLLTTRLLGRLFAALYVAITSCTPVLLVIAVISTSPSAPLCGWTA